MQDVLNEIAHLSLFLQRDDITLTSVLSKVESTQLMLTSLVEVDGPSLSKLNEELGPSGAAGPLVYKEYKLVNPVADHAFRNDRCCIIDKLITCIDRRFRSCTHELIFAACNVFEPKIWPVEQDQLAAFGIEGVDLLLQHFDMLLQRASPPVEPNMARRQWLEMKILITNTHHFVGIQPSEIYRRISIGDAHRSEFNHILQLVHITLLYPLSTSVCERGFSNMKRIKSDWRCSLYTKSLQRSGERRPNSQPHTITLSICDIVTT